MMINPHLYPAINKYVNTKIDCTNQGWFVERFGGILHCHSGILWDSTLCQTCSCAERTFNYHRTCPISDLCWQHSGHYPEIEKAWFIRR